MPSDPTTIWPVFQVSTQADDDAAQERLAVQANWFRPGTRPEDMAARQQAGVEMFIHPYDPVRAKAWVAESLRPFTGDFPRRAGAKRCPIVRGSDQDRRDGIARWIDTLTPQEQFEAAINGVKAFLLALRCLNISIQASEAYRALWSRKVGYHERSPTNDAYWIGWDTTSIRDRLQCGPLQAFEWRRLAWETWTNARPSPQAAMGRTFDSGSVLFGLAADYPVDPQVGDGHRYGCRGEYAWTRCPNPWGECHRIFVQTESTIYGCRLNAPSELAGRLRGWGEDQVADAVLRGGSGVHITAHPSKVNDFFCAIGPAGWRQWMFNAQDSGWVGTQYVRARKRLYACVPFVEYFDLFYLPQMEFSGQSFVGWVMRELNVTRGAGVIRKVKREVSLRNSLMARKHRKFTAADLLGAAEAQALEREIAEERNAGIVGSIVSGAGGGGAQLATRIDPFAGIITGGIVAIASVVAHLLSNSTVEVNIDVFGQLMPAFQPFAIIGAKDALSTELQNTIGWPEGASPSNPDPAGVTQGVTLFGIGAVPPTIDLRGGTGVVWEPSVFDDALVHARGAVTAGAFDRAVMADPTLWRVQ